MRLLHKLEPVFWMLFGAGGFAAALILPALMFGLTIAAPAGWLSDYAISYHRVRGLAANPLGQLILAAVISLVLWHAAHHLRHLCLDLGVRVSQRVAVSHSHQVAHGGPISRSKLVDHPALAVLD